MSGKPAAIAKRLAAIQQRRRSRRAVIVWRNEGEDRETVVARHLAERPEDAGRKLHIIGWRRPGSRIPEGSRMGPGDERDITERVDLLASMLTGGRERP